MAVEIGALRAMLSLDSAAFERGSKRARASMSKLQSGVGSATQFIVAAGKKMAIGIGVIATAAGAGAASAARSLSELGNLSRVAGLSAQEFKVISLAAREFGVEQDKLSDILKDVNDKFGDYLATGQGPLADFFEQIAPKVGITKEAFEGLSSSDALQLYIDSLEKANVSQQEMTFFMEALASDATALIPIFQNNGKAIDDMRERAEALGLSLSDETIAAAQEARREFSVVGEVLKTRFQAALVELLPYLINFTEVVLPALKAALDSLKPVLDFLWRALGFDMPGAVDIAKNALTVTFQAAANVFSEIISSMLEAIRGLRDQLITAIRELATSILEAAKDIGRNILNGIRDGINEKWEDLRSYVTELANQLPDWVKGPLGIQSPSRVFMEIGRDVMRGMEQGIAEASVGVQAALENVAAATSSALDGAGLGESLQSAGGGFFQSFAQTALSAFQQIKSGAQSTGDAIKQFIGQALSQIGNQLLNSGLQQIFGGSGIGSSIGSILTSFFAKGGVFQAGRVTPFANGGVVSSPTVFPMVGGVGEMGEAGPEAIMPLKRLADGKLGVAASGMGGGASYAPTINLTVQGDVSENTRRTIVREIEENNRKSFNRWITNRKNAQGRVD